MSTIQSPPLLVSSCSIEQEVALSVELPTTELPITELPATEVPTTVTVTDPPPKKPPENHVWSWIKAVAVRCVLYFATYLVIAIISIGPMFWTWYESVYFPEGSLWVNKFYAPLVFLCDRIGWLRTLVNWWINWWIL